MTLPQTLSYPDRLWQAEQESLAYKLGEAELSRPQYFTKDGRPTIIPPKTNLVDATGLRIARGSLELGNGWGNLLKSIPEFATGLFLEDATYVPIDLSEGGLRVGGTIKPLSEVTGKDFYQALEPDAKDLLAAQGVTEQNFSELPDYESALDRYHALAKRARIQQELDRYQQLRPGLYITAGVGAFGANVVGDPLNLVTFGTGGLVKSGAEQIVKSTGKGLLARVGRAVGADLAEGATVHQALARQAFKGNILAAHAAIAGFGVGAGAGTDLLNQFAEHHTRVDELGFDERFQYNAARGALGGLVGGLLGELGAVMLGGKPIPMTNREYVLQNPGTLASEHLSNLMRSGKLRDDLLVDLKRVDSMERIQKVLPSLYGHEDTNTFLDLIGDTIESNTRSEEDIASFLMKVPTRNELLGYLSDAAAKNETAISKAQRNLETLPPLIREAYAAGNEKQAKALEKKVSAARATIEEALVGTEFSFDTTLDAGRRLKQATTDNPLPDIYQRIEDRTQRIRQLAPQNAEEAAQSPLADATKYLPRQFYDLLYGGFGTPAAKGRKFGRSQRDWLDPQLALALSLIDGRGQDAFVSHATGRAVKTFSENYDITRAKFQNVQHALDKYRRGLSAEERDVFDRAVYQHAGGIKVSSDQRVIDVATRLRDAYDYAGQMGVRNGTLRKVIADYVPTRIRDTESGGLARLADILAREFRKEYEGDNLHFGTLEELGIINKNKELTQAYKGYKEVPLKRSDLTPEDLGRYEKQLPIGMKNEAFRSIERKTQQVHDRHEDPIALDEARPLIYQTDNRASRKIEQSVFLSDEALDTGAVVTDIKELNRQYSRSTGWRIAEQQTMLEAFGEPVRFDDYLNNLLELSRRQGNDANAASQARMVDMIRATRDSAAGRYIKDPSGIGQALQPVVNLATGTVNAGVVSSMGPEAAISIVNALFKPKEITAFINGFLNSLRNLNKDEYLSLGFFEYEGHNSRFWGESNIRSDGPINNATRAYANTMRIVGLERTVTARLKRANFLTEFSWMGRKLQKNLDRIGVLARNFETPEALKGAIREAGLGGDVELGRLVRRLGLAEPDMVAAYRRILELDPQAYKYPGRMQAAIGRETDDVLRSNMLEFYDRLRRYGKDRAESLITTPSAATRLPGQSPLAAAVMQFTTFPFSFFNVFLKRMADSPLKFSMALLGSYLVGEALSTTLRDVIYNGESIDTIQKKWNDNPAGMLASVFVRSPWTGPYSDLQYNVANYLNDRPIGFRFGSPPAIGMTSSFVRDTVSGATKIINGEDPTDKEARSFYRAFPLTAPWYIRSVMRGMYNGFEAHSDRDR